MKPTINIVFFLVLILLLPACSQTSDLTIDDPWVRPGAKGQNTAIYFTIHGGSSKDALIDAASDAAVEVMIHKSVMAEDGKMSMEHQMMVEIPPDEIINFEPGGLHIMLMDLVEDLEEGDRVDLTLIFDQTGEVLIDAPVKSP